MDLLAEAFGRGCSLAVATRGPDGAILFDGQSWFRQASRPVTPTDTLGAGDAFISGFLVSYVGDKDDTGVQQASLIEHSLEKAASFAADICLVNGAFGRGLRY
jgi:fructoselysine 6-kinase